RVDEADPGPVPSGQADEVIEQQRVVRVLRDPAATDRYDLPPRHRRPSIRASGHHRVRGPLPPSAMAERGGASYDVLGDVKRGADHAAIVRCDTTCRGAA